MSYVKRQSRKLNRGSSEGLLVALDPPECLKISGMARTAMSLACAQLGLVGDQILTALESQPGSIPPNVMARMESSSFIPTRVISQVFSHPAFKSAVTEVSRVRFLRPVLHREGRPGPLVGTGGSASILQPENVALALLGGAIEYFAVEGKRPSTEELQARIQTSADELQAGLGGSQVPLRRVVGFADCPLAEDCSVVTPWGELRRASGRLAELTLGDRTANAVMITSYEGHLDISPQGSTSVPTMTPAEFEFHSRWHTLLPLSVILGCGGDGLIAPIPVWQRIISCISGTGGMWGWIPQSRFGAQRQAPLHPDECASIGAWAERLEVLFDERYLGGRLGRRWSVRAPKLPSASRLGWPRCSPNMRAHA